MMMQSPGSNSMMPMIMMMMNNQKMMKMIHCLLDVKDKYEEDECIDDTMDMNMMMPMMMMMMMGQNQREARGHDSSYNPLQDLPPNSRIIVVTNDDYESSN